MAAGCGGGSDLPALTVTIPATAAEDGGDVTGTVSVAVAPASDLTVGLASDNTDRATVPAQVILPSSGTSVDFTITIVNNGDVVGDELVTITATAGSYEHGYDSMTVTEDDVATITVVIPQATINEGSTLPGTVMVNVAPSTDLEVTLTTTDDTLLAVVSPVMILAGEISAAISITATENGTVDGDVDVDVVPDAVGYVPVSDTITVIDND